MKAMLVGAAALGALGLLAGGCTHASKRDLIGTTNISLIEAVRTAEASVTGARAVEAELEKEDGRAVYEVELIDAKQDKRKVYVDAGSGKVVQLK
ncbi:MAG TPA: PepSY domain-containing protein [Nitrospiraceae bacterium]|nr:PepSY domain-containing protein [Nitrospiraceae bacterium]